MRAVMVSEFRLCDGAQVVTVLGECAPGCLPLPHPAGWFASRWGRAVEVHGWGRAGPGPARRRPATPGSPPRLACGAPMLRTGRPRGRR